MEDIASETHILAFPYPAQGHMNPMVQLSKRLASKGLKVTLITTTSTSKSIQTQACSFHFEIITDVSYEGVKTEDTEEYVQRFRVVVSQSLSELIESLNKTKNPPKFLIYDSGMPWVLNIARRLGLDGAPFFTQPCAVGAIYYHVYQGALSVPLEASSMVSFPSMPPLAIDDLPSFLHNSRLYPAFLKSVVNQFSNIEEANWLLCNTFDKLESEIVNWMASRWPIKTIGPTVPSIYLDKRLRDDKDYGLSLFKPNTDGCMKWLNSKEVGSVVYVAFGSLAGLGEEQMEELVWGLKRSNYYYLWVVRESEEKKLPRNFLEETSKKGLVVKWSPQLEVLAHKATGCFMTHCGWNSTLESLSLGVPMVAMPHWTDQTTNAKFVADVWEVGVRVKKNEKGIVTREEIELCLKEVMEGERANEIKRNSDKWKSLAKEAVDEGGSSDKNIEEFVAELLRK
ncbi:UDPGT domain-containing protein [Cephalotus follicularis]|uniref:Glycosyltransferase n=1 Tax=Cephalotus follicularis TaxID=3775 RepID=A0A1Q3BGR8_CEPFO|nr:UDPGT domain-containing protein [Cephalotus follicularis]